MNIEFLSSSRVIEQYIIKTNKTDCYEDNSNLEPNKGCRNSNIIKLSLWSFEIHTDRQLRHRLDENMKFKTYSKHRIVYSINTKLAMKEFEFVGNSIDIYGPLS
jgi:hypothetical protein